MPAIVERRRLNDGSLTVFEVPPDESTFFHTDTAVGAIGQSIMVHCLPGDTITNVYPGLNETTAIDINDPLATHARYLKQRTKRVVQPGYPFKTQMNHAADGLIELTVRQGLQLPNTEVMVLPLPNPIDAKPLVKTLLPGQHTTVTDMQTDDIGYIQILQDKLNYAHIFAASTLQLGYQAMKLIERDTTMLSQFIQSDAFLLDIVQPGDPAFNLPIHNLSRQACTLLVRNSDNRSIAPTNN